MQRKWVEEDLKHMGNQAVILDEIQSLIVPCYTQDQWNNTDSRSN